MAAPLQQHTSHENLRIMPLEHAAALDFKALLNYISRLTSHPNPPALLSWILQRGLGYPEGAATSLSKWWLEENLLKRLWKKRTWENFQPRLLASEHNRPETYKSPHQIYLALDLSTLQLVDIVGLLPEDADMAKSANISDPAIDPYYFGLYCPTRSDPDKDGIGALMMEFLRKTVQEYVNKTKRPAAIWAFSPDPNSPRSRHLRNVGFDPQPQVRGGPKELQTFYRTLISTTL
jgi:hypothetical protein